MGKKMSQSINHLTAKWKKLAQKSTNKDMIILQNLKLWQKFGLVGEVKWYNHKHESMMDISTSKQTMSFDTEGMI